MNVVSVQDTVRVPPRREFIDPMPISRAGTARSGLVSPTMFVIAKVPTVRELHPR
jgi:hypothetical protein